MTREENLYWLNQEIQTWENECQSKHPIKEALYAARKSLEQEPSEDAVSRDDVVRIVQHNNPPKALEKIRKLSSVTPQEPRWIPIKTRKLTDAEEEDMFENSNYYYNYMFDCLLPEDGEEVLVTTSTGEVTDTTFYDEGIDGCYFEFYEDEGDVIAWMQKPKSYKAKSEVEDGNDD